MEQSVISLSLLFPGDGFTVLFNHYRHLKMFSSNVPRTLCFPPVWLCLQTVEMLHLVVRCLDLQRPRVPFYQACLAHHRQSGRRSASLLFCEWCFCGSSNADHDLASRSSFWACSYTGPTASPPGGYKRDVKPIFIFKTTERMWKCQMYR